MVKFVETECKSLINRMHESEFVTHIYSLRLTANPYSGCQFDCSYCYAPFVYAFRGDVSPEEFGSVVFVKKNAADVAKRDLLRITNSEHYKGFVDIGTVTDAYQFAERKYMLMPQLLQVFLDLQYPATVLTKSDLILRDLELWQELARKELGVVGLTITMSPDVRGDASSFLEPFAPSSQKRIQTLEQLIEAGIGVYVFMDPIVPFISDNPTMLRNLIQLLAQAGAKGVFAGIMKLSPLTWSLFRKRLMKFKPELVPQLEVLYFKKGIREFGRSWCPPDEYTENVYRTIRTACEDYEIGFSCERFFDLWTYDCWTVEEPYGHPTGYNLWKILEQHKGRTVSLEEFLTKVQSLRRVTDRTYIRELSDLWNSGKLLRGAKGIQRIQLDESDGGFAYRFQSP